MFEDKCKRNACQHFNLLESYEIKHKIFSNLIGEVFVNEIQLSAILGDDAPTLINAVLETPSLREINILINENLDLVKAIADGLKNMSSSK